MSKETSLRREDLLIHNRARDEMDQIADKYWEKRDADEDVNGDDGANSIMQQMMDVALRAKQAEEDAVDDEQRKHSKKGFGDGLFKRGFLQSKSKKASGRSSTKPSSDGLSGKMNGKAATDSTHLSSKQNISKPSVSANDNASAQIHTQSHTNNTVEKTTEDVPILRPNKTNQDDSNGLRLPEVQEAMKNSSSWLRNGEWINDEVLKQMSSDSVIAQGLQHPRCIQAIDEMNKDPAMAKQKYKDDPLVTKFLMRFMTIMGQHFENMADKEENASKVSTSNVSSANTNKKPTATSLDDAVRDVRVGKLADQARRGDIAKDDQEVRQVLSNNEVVSLLMDPTMQRVMDESRRDPSKFAAYLKDPDIRAKFKVLEHAGLVRIE